MARPTIAEHIAAAQERTPGKACPGCDRRASTGPCEACQTYGAISCAADGRMLCTSCWIGHCQACGPELCECCEDVKYPGILLMNGDEIQRCDDCHVYETDADAADVLRRLGFVIADVPRNEEDAVAHILHVVEAIPNVLGAPWFTTCCPACSESFLLPRSLVATIGNGVYIGHLDLEGFRSPHAPEGAASRVRCEACQHEWVPA